jgi:hypothetical protein
MSSARENALEEAIKRALKQTTEKGLMVTWRVVWD